MLMLKIFYNLVEPPPNKNEEELANLVENSIKTSVDMKDTKKYSHWLQYLSSFEQTPKYIIDAKKRLNQIHPCTPPQIKKVETVSLEETTHISSKSPIPTNTVPAATNAHLARHFLTYDCPETPEDIRIIRRKYRDERYRREDPRNVKITYSTMKPNDLNNIATTESAKNSVSIPEPNISLSTFDETKPLLNRSKSAVGIIRNVTSPQKSTDQPQAIQAHQQPITIIYNNYQVPNQQGAPLTPEYLAALANSIASNPGIAEQTTSNQNAIAKSEEKSSELQSSNSKEAQMNNEWDKYYDHNSNKNRSVSRMSVKSKTPSPTLNELNERVVT
jgi:hypothetical protein